jgi:hypothetical protein
MAVRHGERFAPAPHPHPGCLELWRTKKEIMEVILQMLVYCGAPYVLQAARLARHGVSPHLEPGVKASLAPAGTNAAARAFNGAEPATSASQGRRRP